MFADFHVTVGFSVFLVIALRAVWSTGGYLTGEPWFRDRIVGMVTAGLVDLQGLLGILALIATGFQNLIHPALALLAIAAVHIGNRRWNDQRGLTGPLLHWLAVLLLAGHVI